MLIPCGCWPDSQGGPAVREVSLRQDSPITGHRRLLPPCYYHCKGKKGGGSKREGDSRARKKAVSNGITALFHEPCQEPLTALQAGLNPGAWERSPSPMESKFISNPVCLQEETTSYMFRLPHPGSSENGQRESHHLLAVHIKKQVLILSKIKVSGDRYMYLPVMFSR